MEQYNKEDLNRKFKASQDRTFKESKAEVHGLFLFNVFKGGG